MEKSFYCVQYKSKSLIDLYDLAKQQDFNNISLIKLEFNLQFNFCFAKNKELNNFALTSKRTELPAFLEIQKYFFVACATSLLPLNSSTSEEEKSQITLVFVFF